MKTPLEKIKEELKDQKASLKEKDDLVEADPDMQDDTEWVNDYHNQQGFIDALKFAIDLLEKEIT